ncbi:MAG: hypothetical protein DRQ47_02485 [Gammaproteobacteria bacterium]|nr:MAG: hypothetical protein DRQ47_02485 [Gammaproteobacteria bacterium]
MSTVSEYIQLLTKISNDLPEEVGRIIKRNEGKILTMIKLRLYQTGIDGDGNLIGNYSSYTKKRKKDKGQPAAHITLRDTGEFYSSLFTTFNGEELFIHSSSDKAPMLVEEYGEAILELTEQEINIILDGIVEPQINKYISDNLPEVIDFGF